MQRGFSNVAVQFFVCCSAAFGRPGSVRFGHGFGMERLERFRFSVPAVPLRRGFLCVSVQFSREDGSGFGSWKMVPVPRSVPGKTVPTVPVSGSGSVPGPPCFGKNGIGTAEKRMLHCNFCSATFRKLQRNFCFSLVTCCRVGVSRGGV